MQGTMAIALQKTASPTENDGQIAICPYEEPSQLWYRGNHRQVTIHIQKGKVKNAGYK